jgi:hypothetical protein
LSLEKHLLQRLRSFSELRLFNEKDESGSSFRHVEQVFKAMSDLNRHVQIDQEILCRQSDQSGATHPVPGELLFGGCIIDPKVSSKASPATMAMARRLGVTALQSRLAG